MEWGKKTTKLLPKLICSIYYINNLPEDRHKDTFYMYSLWNSAIYFKSMLPKAVCLCKAEQTAANDCSSLLFLLKRHYFTQDYTSDLTARVHHVFFLIFTLTLRSWRSVTPDPPPSPHTLSDQLTLSHFPRWFMKENKTLQKKKKNPQRPTFSPLWRKNLSCSLTCDHFSGKCVISVSLFDRRARKANAMKASRLPAICGHLCLAFFITTRCLCRIP